MQDNAAPSWDGVWPLVGREPELAALEQILSGARRKRPAIVHVVGDPGLGKTRLIGEVAQRAEAMGMLVLRGVGSGRVSGRLFAAIAEPFASYLAGGQTDLRADPDLPRLAGLADLAARSGDDADPGDDPGSRVVSDAVRRVLSRLAAPRPVVLLLDDVQWCDEGTLDVLTSLSRHPPRGGVVVMLGYRPLERVRALEQVRPGRIEGPVVGSLHRLELAALAEDQLAELMPDVSSARRRALFAACGGNPFYLQAVQLAGGDIVPGVTGGDALPAAVRSALAAELDALDPQVRRVADAAAIVGAPLDPDLVAHVSGVDRDTVLDALDALCSRTICRPVGVGRWQFRHPLLARVAHDEQSAAVRFRAHHAAAEELARQGAPLSERARHIAASSRRGDLQAAKALVAAADRAAAQAPGQASRWYTVALDIAPNAEPSWVQEVELARAGSLLALGRLDDAHAIVHDLLARADEAVPQRIAAAALAARVAYLLGHHDEAGALLQRELDSAVEWPPESLAALHLELATARLMGGDFGGAREAAELALELAPAATAPTMAGAAAAITLSCVANGDVEVALGHQAEAARLLDGLSDVELASSLQIGVWLGWAEMFLELGEDSRRHLERCLRIARRGAHQHLLTHLLVGWGSVLKTAGDLPGAGEAYDEARAAAERVGSRELTTMATAMQCRAATWRGDLAAAEHFGAEAVAMTAERSTWFASVAAALLAQARLFAGDASGCVAAILHAGGGPDLPGFDPGSRCDWWDAAITAAVMEGDLNTATDLAQRSERAAAELPLQAPAGFAHLGRARIALAAGDATTAAAAAAEAVSCFVAAGHRLETARAQLLQAAGLAAVGDRAAALALLEVAEAVFADCRAARLRAEARAELRRLGRRVAGVSAGGAVRRIGGVSTGDDGLASLSARERQVSALVADGLTNRQIAADLVVSEKTVESHLAHIFVKLGVSSRAAVAAAVGRERA